MSSENLGLRQLAVASLNSMDEAVVTINLSRPGPLGH